MTTIKHVVTVHVEYDDPSRLEDGDFSIGLVNFSGMLHLNSSGQTDIDLINECAGEWLTSEPRPRANFVSLTLREEFEPADQGYDKRYEVVESYISEVTT